MIREDDYTIHEHYVPRVLLRGFSPNYSMKKTGMKRKNLMIWRYDCNTQSSAFIPEDSVCREDNLYESTGKDGKIVFRNHIEKKLSAIEKVFERFRTKLEQKAFNEANYKTKCFLDKDEKDFWVLYIVHQILRNPDIIREAASLFQSSSGTVFTSEQARNLALFFCTPYYQPLDDSTPEAKAFVNMMIPMREMNFCVAVSIDGRFVTSDKAVFVLGEMGKNCSPNYDLILFPVTAFLCLILSKRGRKKAANQVFLANEKCERELFQAFCARSNTVFSRYEINSNTFVESNNDAQHEYI